MSMLIRGGYYAVKKQILNVNLKPTTLWHEGLILTNKNMVITRLNPKKENNIELVNYKNTALLLLNNTVIYENNKLFNYNIDLSFTNDDFIFNKYRFDKCISYDFINLHDMKNYRGE
jgi:hypothetical protein